MRKADIIGTIRPITEETKLAYIKQCQSLQKQAAKELGQHDLTKDDFLTWYLSQTERWSAATLRLYKAALKHELSTDPDFLSRPEQLERFQIWLDIGPQAKPKKQRPKTAAKKRKKIDDVELAKLLGYFEERESLEGRVLSEIIFCIMNTAARPNEALSVKIDSSSKILKLKNSKYNPKDENTRSYAPNRILMSVDEEILGSFKIIKSYIDSEKLKGETHKQIYERLRGRLAYACKKCGIKRISFYTLRHAAIAEFKHYLAPDELAYVLGHNIDDTATKHYARKSKSKKSKGPSFALPRGARQFIKQSDRVGRLPSTARDGALRRSVDYTVMQQGALAQKSQKALAPAQPVSPKRSPKVVAAPQPGEAAQMPSNMRLVESPKAPAAGKSEAPEAPSQVPTPPGFKP